MLLYIHIKFMHVKLKWERLWEEGRGGSTWSRLRPQRIRYFNVSGIIGQTFFFLVIEQQVK